MKKQVLLFLVSVIPLCGINLADTFGTGDNQFTIDFVTISGDTNPSEDWGTVNYDYRMGVYEITNGQWDKFVNINGAPTGKYPDAYNQDAYWTDTNMPANYISWLEAIQFVNWLNTSTGHQPAYKFIGTQRQSNYEFVRWEPTDPGYDHDNPFRNTNAHYFLPTKNEWQKAASWNGTTLQGYSTKPGETYHQGDGVSGTGWNYYDDGYAMAYEGPWDVGSGSEELNGTYDILGNVNEWMESPYSDYYYGFSSQDRCLKGGSYRGNEWAFAKSSYGFTWANKFIGFRVASVPEQENTPPVAIAGPNQVVYVCDDYELADVSLDGSGSYDDNSDVLDYYWSWYIDSNMYEANGVSLTIQLPVGTYEIELIVDDGTELSEPNYCTVTVVEPLHAKMLCIPSFINTQSRRENITAFVYMPQGIEPNDIDANEPLLFICDSNAVEQKRQFVFKWQQHSRSRTWIMASFDKGDCIDILSPGSNRIKVAGRLNSSRCYYADFCIYVYKPKPFRRIWKFPK